MKLIPVIITPLDDHMGLDIARSLGKRGIPVYGIDSDPGVVGRHSTYCRFVRGPNPTNDGETDYVRFLVEFGKKLGCKAVLFPLSDKDVLICSRNRVVLQNYFEYVMTDHKTMETLTTKDGLRSVAQQYEILAPKTFFVSDVHEIENISGHIPFPAIIKPTESTHWHTLQITKALRHGLFAGQAKVILCHNPAELIKAYHLVAVCNSRVVVQEVIPGEDSRLVYCSFYLDRQSRPLCIFTGRKYRVIPTGFGSASYVRSFYDAELVELCLKFVSAIRYQGLGGIEFKKDPRDGRYKLIEFNTRFGMWDGLSVKCGVDLPFIAYCDALRLPVNPQMIYRSDVIWVDWQRDFRAAFEYWRKGQFSLGRWLQSLRGEKMWAIYSKDDWRPGVAFTLTLIRKLWNRISHG